MIFQLLSDLLQAEHPMLLRMKKADELVAPSHGLSTAAHPFVLPFTEPTPPANVPISIVPTILDPPSAPVTTVPMSQPSQQHAACPAPFPEQAVTTVPMSQPSQPCHRSLSPMSQVPIVGVVYEKGAGHA